jgi:outer membrane protein OmpA-like peptidoglycan-associated protein
VCPAPPTPPTPPTPAAPPKLVLLKPVEFATSQAVILQSSFPTLQNVAKTLADNPQLKRIRIEGHTDGDGTDADNLKLSQDRVKSVVKWLVSVAKVDAARLEGYACGESLPIASNQTVAGKQENRRVDFLIVDPVPLSFDSRDLSKCVPAN